MAFGLLVKQDKKKVAVMTGSLHQWFKEEYLVTCCKVLSAHGKSGCPKITARVAAKVTQLVLAQGQPTVQPKA